MKNTFRVLLVVGAALGAGQIARAQQAMGPPKVLVISREVEKPGKRAAHEKWEAGWPAAFAKVKWPVHYLAACSVTGEPRCLFITGYESMEAWEKDNQAQARNSTLSAELGRLAAGDADYITETRTGAFTYEPEISYPRVEGSLGTRRYFLIVSYRVKPGHGGHFNEVRKLIKAAHEKINAADHYAIFHNAAGSDAGLYLIFLPITSLAEWDKFPDIHGKEYQDALGEEGQKKVQEFSAQGVESIEVQLFAFNPKMSYPQDEYIQADPEFWKPKPAARPAARKEAAKPAGN